MCHKLTFCYRAASEIKPEQIFVVIFSHTQQSPSCCWASKSPTLAVCLVKITNLLSAQHSFSLPSVLSIVLVLSGWIIVGDLNGCLKSATRSARLTRSVANLNSTSCQSILLLWKCSACSRVTHSLQRQCGITAKCSMGQDCKRILSFTLTVKNNCRKIWWQRWWPISTFASSSWLRCL